MKTPVTAGDIQQSMGDKSTLRGSVDN